MVKVENLSKSYGPQDLFEDVSFVVNPGERVGLVGRNGHGKTTLFRIILGTEEADSGTVATPRGYTLGHLSQKLDFTEDTVLGEAMKGLPESEDGVDLSWKAESVLFGLGFSPAQVEGHPSTLSGGFQVRLSLARTLVSGPDLLLLDEPTNYLDIVSLRWLRRYLNTWPGELILITHDRDFMDAVTTHTMGIHRRKVMKFEGPTSHYYSRIAEEEEVHERKRAKDEKERAEAEKFIERFRAKASKASVVQSRVKALERREKLGVLDEVKTLDFSFNYAPFHPKVPMTVTDLTFGYEGGATLIDGLSLALGREDRVGVIGPNGKGKSTLLKLLADELRPSSGGIERSARLEVAYFGQNVVEGLDPAKTVEEELMSAGAEREEARRVAGSMLFEGDSALKKISVLSGGERSRVALGRVLLYPANLLILDEPTNHLDMDSVEALASAVEDFEGAVVMVTHSESLLERTAERLVVFDSGSVDVFDGPYRDFLREVGWSGEAGPGAGEAGAAAGGAGRKEGAGRPGKKELRRMRAEVVSERSEALGPVKKRMGEIEGEITRLEGKIEDLDARLAEASSSGSVAGEGSDGGGIEGLSKERHDCERRIEDLFTELEELSARHDAAALEFDSRLEELGR